MTRKIILGLLLCCASTAFSQAIAFELVFGSKKITQDAYCKLPSGDSLSIDNLKFYISNIRLLKKGKVVFTESDSYHLVDAFDAKSQHINFPNLKSDFDQIAFAVGIDSLANVSGAMGGDLDATKGMYWSWQSGYINFKIEGKSNLYVTRKNEFFFHLGGYMAPNETIQEVVLDVSNKGNVIIKVDIEKFIASFDFGKQQSLMVPGEKAKQLSQKLVAMFEIEQ